MSLPQAPYSHPASTTGHMPTQSVGPLPAHLSDLGSPERTRIGSPAQCLEGSIQRARMSAGPSAAGVSYSASPQRSFAYPAASAAATSPYPAGGYSPQFGSPGRTLVPTVLPSPEYMQNAAREAHTNENSPARQRGGAASPPSMYSQPQYTSPAPVSYQPQSVYSQAQPLHSMPAASSYQPQSVAQQPQSRAAPVSPMASAAPMVSAPLASASPASHGTPSQYYPKIVYYWGSLSQPSRAIKAFLDDSGLPFEAVHVDMMKGEHKSDAITAINPAGTVPFVTIDGKLYKETVAVMRYFCNRFPQHAAAYPEDIEARFLIDKACDFYTDGFRPAFVKEMGVRFQAFGGQRDLTDFERELFAGARASQDKMMEALETLLDSTPGRFVVGDSLTLADYVLYAELQDMKYMRPDKAGTFRRVAQYEADCLAASPGLYGIHRPDGEWATQVVPAVQGLFASQGGPAAATQ